MDLQVASRPVSGRVGQTISHYRVLRLIGHGGMGDVYEAEDVRLRRRVALKFLAAERPTSSAARRFEREARTASALNHPHICTIYDIGEHEGEQFLAMELLEGQTVRESLRRGPFQLPALLDIAIQVSGALDAAHRAHVVHRDISPANIFLVGTAHAKLLDFGLARLETSDDAGRSVDDVSTTTAELALTSPGVVVGTVAYMSPEQVAGEPLDHRSDLFALGSVLYEMATGHRPFEARTVPLVLDAILHRQPQAVTTLNPALPPALDGVLARALEKDRRLRYQSAADLQSDLHRLQRDVQSLPGHPPPRTAAGKRPWLALAVAAVGALVGLSGWELVRWSSSDAVPEAAARQVTSGTGVESDPAISPDGHTIAYTSDESGNRDIWLVDAAGGPAKRWTTNGADDAHASWLPDGRSIVFTSERRGQPDVWVAPALDGDAATLFVEHADSPAVSPDGRVVAFVTPGPGGYGRIAVQAIAAARERHTLTGDRGGRWDHQDPAWSPDGTTLVYAAWDGLWTIPAAGGTARQLTRVEGDVHPAWAPDGRHLYFTALREGQPELWRIRADGSGRSRVTLGSGAAVSPSISKDGHLIAFTSSVRDYDLRLVRLQDGRETRFGSSRDDLLPSFGPDVVYFVSNRWGTHTIWAQAMGPEGLIGQPRRVLDQAGAQSQPSCSADGRWLTYCRILDGRRDVWVAGTDGERARPITIDGSSYHPAWSPDGRALAYVSERAGRPQLFVQRMAGGSPTGGAELVVDANRRLIAFPAWAPAGHLIAFITAGPTGLGEAAVVSARGGPFRLVTTDADAVRARWGRQQGTLLVSAHWGRSGFELRTIVVEGGHQTEKALSVPLGRDVTDAAFDVSGDGRWFVTGAARQAGHTWVMENEKSSF